MDELQTILQDALAGRGQMVMLTGELGIGKTRVAQELAAAAQSQGVRVLWGRCYEGLGAPPSGPGYRPSGNTPNKYPPNASGRRWDPEPRIPQASSLRLPQCCPAWQNLPNWNRIRLDFGYSTPSRHLSRIPLHRPHWPSYWTTFNGPTVKSGEKLYWQGGAKLRH